MTRVVHSRTDFLRIRAEAGGAVGLVPTMGALHPGHAALLDSARPNCDPLIMTVFVNPLQFAPTEDLDRYPRTLDADVALAEAHGVDLVWAPAVEDVYAGGPAQVMVSPGPLGDILEGAVRPGHFAGVLTVVAKLLNLARPARAWFGQKDYQQLVLIRRMVLDLDLGVQITGVPTVREPDGLALSSRNVFLSPAERERAVLLSTALRTGTLDGARAKLAGVEVDYLEQRADDLGPGTDRLLVAARFGSTRLIDNMETS